MVVPRVARRDLRGLNMPQHAWHFFARLSFGTCATIAAASAHGADQIRYVSSTGVNTNDCTLAAPCRTLQRGINKTPAGGELRVLDSGGYGTSATIDKSITISGNRVTVTGSALAINAATATVALRGLEFNGIAANANGIRIEAAAAMHIEGCVIRGFAQDGIQVDGAAGTELFVIDTIARDNGDNGLSVINTTTARLTVDNSRFENNGLSGLFIAAPGIDAAVTRAVASGNGNVGIGTSGASGRINISSTMSAHNSIGYSTSQSGQMTLDSATARGNNTGLLLGVGATARISNSVITNNNTGIQNGATVLTRRNNVVSGNTTDLVGPPPVKLEPM
jgi:hypothetical protein